MKNIYFIFKYRIHFTPTVELRDRQTEIILNGYHAGLGPSSISFTE